MSELVTRSQLSRLKTVYTSALYSFFQITNLQESWEKFSETGQAPQFRYADTVNLKSVRKRLANLKKDLALVTGDDDGAIDFLEWRIAETEILELFLAASRKPKAVTPESVKHYQDRQRALYGSLSAELYNGVVTSLKRMVTGKHPELQIAYDELVQLLSFERVELFAPPEATFQHYRKVLRHTTPRLQEVIKGIHAVDEYTSHDIKAIFDQALEAVGAKQFGWKVQGSYGGGNVLVSKYRKSVLVGRNYKPQSAVRFKQVVMHEVACHVQRSLTEPKQAEGAGIDEEEEGLAVVLEQLMNEQFVHKRTLRYLAVCLAVGVDGKPRTFNEVYEALWRAAFIVGKNKDRAKERAFYETSRVFRGGLPEVPGMVFIKDKVYLESNLKVWQLLEGNRLTAEAFAALLRPTHTLSGEGAIL